MATDFDVCRVVIDDRESDGLRATSDHADFVTQLLRDVVDEFFGHSAEDDDAEDGYTDHSDDGDADC